MADLFEQVRALESRVKHLSRRIRIGETCLSVQKDLIKRNDKIIAVQDVRIQASFERQVD